MTYAYNRAGQPKPALEGHDGRRARVGQRERLCGVTYAAHGGMSAGAFCAVLTESYGFNGLLQATAISAARSGVTLWTLGTYDAPYNDGNIVGPSVNPMGAGGVRVGVSGGLTLS